MLILGHRGAVSSSTPENTLASIDRALNLGADGVEIDVRLTADCVPVCLHDPTLGRTTGTHAVLADTLSAQRPASVPTLAEVLDLVGGRGRLVVEMKKPDVGVVGTVPAIMGVLRRHHLHDVVVSSFDRKSLRELRNALDAEHHPLVRTALLGRPGVPLGPLLRCAVADGHDEIHPHVLSALVRVDLARRAAQQGITTTPWTVNRHSDLQRLAHAGVDAVICDDPFDARLALQPVAVAHTG